MSCDPFEYAAHAAARPRDPAVDIRRNGDVCERSGKRVTFDREGVTDACSGP
jgi:hypothetical protein